MSRRRTTGDLRLILLTTSLAKSFCFKQIGIATYIAIPRIPPALPFFGLKGILRLVFYPELSISINAIRKNDEVSPELLRPMLTVRGGGVHPTQVGL
jgi:hypothetical protein